MKNPNNISLVWTFEDWEQMEKKSNSHLKKIENELKMKEHLVNLARLVLRAHSTSFFIVTRFLPKTKRDNVELIYCAVRYPDEIVDSFKFWLPFVEIQDIKVNFNDNSQMDVSVEFNIKQDPNTLESVQVTIQGE